MKQKVQTDEKNYTEQSSPAHSFQAFHFYKMYPIYKSKYNPIVYFFFHKTIKSNFKLNFKCFIKKCICKANLFMNSMISLLFLGLLTVDIKLIDHPFV